MNVQEAIEYINAHTWSQWKLGLSRTRDLLALLGNPQKQLRFVHVAGSNGKGSTCAMLERILREAGYVTGFYPSPYIEDFRERIQVCGEYIPEEALARITSRVKELADSMEDHPTQFELITAIGMVWFAECCCDLVVLEVGLGGTYDSTNIIDAPEAAVITNIGLEHTEYLGKTLTEIAGNKCGIIKSGSDVVCYENEPEVMEVVRRTCAGKGCPLHVARYSGIRPLRQSLEGQTFLYQGEEYRLALLGEYQLHNAATVLTVVETLRGRGFEIPGEAVRKGFENVTWPARFELLSAEPLFLLDGGHNPQCADALVRSLSLYLPGEKVIFLIGMLADKDYQTVISLLAPHAAGFVCLTPDSPRALPAGELAAYLTERGLDARACETAEEGIRTALELAGSMGNVWRPVVSFGSLYMAGAVRHVFPAAVRSFMAETGADISARKKMQRARALRGRRSMTAEERSRASASICASLADMAQTVPALKRAETVFTYGAAQDEADPGEFNRLLERAGKTVCYPLCGAEGRMTARIPDAGDPQAWKNGAWGIREPVPERSREVDPSLIDAVIIPCVAFDRKGGRCGHGAGYYDRYLAQLPREIPRILIAFDAQEVPETALEPTDLRMDWIVTESGTSCI